jgi:mono/diheme cytochrome c family protein
MSAHDPHAHRAPLHGEASDDSIQDVHAELVHKKPEQAEGYSMLPLALLGFVSSMIFIVSIYFVHHRADFDPLAYDERYVAKAGSAAPTKAVDPLVAGKKLYGQVCSQCHLPNGAGQPGSFPPLVKSEWVTGSEDRLIRILLHGLSGEIEVAGAKYNGAMPAIGPGGGYSWSDDKIAHVATYIRQEWGNAAPPVTPEKVKEVRTVSAADRKTPWTAAELQAVP